MFQTFVFLMFLNEGHAILWAKRDNRTSYEKYQLWQAHIQDVNLTSEFKKMIAEKDVWHRSDNNIDFLLNGNETEYWNKFLESQNISYEVLLVDVQRAIEKEDLMKKYGDWRRGGKINWTSHPTLKDIYDYLKSVANADSKSCSLQSIGKTVHKKDITVLKLSNGKPENEAFLLEAGMHGQEWLAVVSLLYFIEHIAWNFTKQPNYIKNKDWYILPVSNPDGYEYSRTKDRLWRKNRKQFSGPCDGVDLNRNFDFNWSNGDTSMDICSAHYGGPVPFSEQETIALKNLIESHHFTGYVSIHSYGSAVLFPWIYDGTPTIDAAAHIRLAKEMVTAMSAVANVHYRAGTSKQLHMRKASGNSLDWAYSRGVKFTFALETRGGTSQFVDTSQLLPTAKEVVVGLKRMAEVVFFNWSNGDTSMDICSAHYGGPVPFSEQETIALKNLIESHHFTGYVSIHSYGSAVLFPWIYDGTPTIDAAAHIRLAKEMVTAMSAVANVHYRAGTSKQLHMRKASGNSLDWAYSRGVKFTFALETRGGTSQFVDTSQLLPTAKEVVVGLKRMAEVVL